MSCHQQQSGIKFSQSLVNQTPAYERPKKPRRRQRKKAKKSLYD